MKIKTEVKTEDLDVKELKKIFDESVGGTKAYFISKVQQKYPNLNKKDAPPPLSHFFLKNSIFCA